ncbi:MAG: DUF1801 domain-containing protein [Flavobacteriales bacterium]|nr:DUF1801 domain-containing protein [Flavobacteriales bacterium]MCB0789044.1 DUF1801 domain-containing protein [Flavobacteriales bacterium]HPJ53798.1 DUF1801 domain-containing protein [Flavobacteriales bacterium]
MTPEIEAYHEALSESDQAICALLAETIASELPEAEGKVWHGHPVWFIEGNPIVGYSRQKAGLRLMFWSGADFGEEGLDVRGEKFKDASVFYTRVGDIDQEALRRWLQRSREVQWDYKNLVKRKGRLERLK